MHAGVAALLHGQCGCGGEDGFRASGITCGGGDDEVVICRGGSLRGAGCRMGVAGCGTDSEIQIKHFMNLGIAAATPRGLMVPNIKDAQELSLRELAIALNNLTTRAREGKTQPAEMANGTLTITNIGSLGIDTGTPIINPGEVAIVAFGTIKQKPWVVDGEVIPRWVTTVSYTHLTLPTIYSV